MIETLKKRNLRYLFRFHSLSFFAVLVIIKGWWQIKEKKKREKEINLFSTLLPRLEFGCPERFKLVLLEMLHLYSHFSVYSLSELQTVQRAPRFYLFQRRESSLCRSTEIQMHTQGAALGCFTCCKPAWFSAQIWAPSRVFVPLNPLFPLLSPWGARHSTVGADVFFQYFFTGLAFQMINGPKRFNKLN